VKQNLVEIERYIDRKLRVLGPLPALAITHYDPETGSCILVYRPDSGEIPCSDEERSNALSLVYSSERQGFQSFIRPTETYVKNVSQQQRSVFALTELVLTLLATLVALLAAWAVRSRLAGADEQIDAFQGSLSSKEALTGLIHSTVIDNLEQVVGLARRVKDAPGIGVEERRYLNIALSEMVQLRLSLDSSIMASQDSRISDAAFDDQEEIDIHDLAQRVQDELQRLAVEEGLDCRLLLDDDLPKLIRGPGYWIESALLAFINTALNFTDEGFIELSLWTELSLEGEPELCARIRDTGLGWSLGDETLDHPTLDVLRSILQGLGAVIASSDVSTGTGQEHVICFVNQGK
jgi:signal transduction histidine kinase